MAINFSAKSISAGDNTLFSTSVTDDTTASRINNQNFLLQKVYAKVQSFTSILSVKQVIIVRLVNGFRMFV